MIDFEIAHAMVIALIEVVAGRKAGLQRGLGECIENIPAQTLFFHAPFAARAMHGCKAERLVDGVARFGRVESVMAFVRGEILERLPP